MEIPVRIVGSYRVINLRFQMRYMYMPLKHESDEHKGLTWITGQTLLSSGGN